MSGFPPGEHILNLYNFFNVYNKHLLVMFPTVAALAGIENCFFQFRPLRKRKLRVHNSSVSW